MVSVIMLVNTFVRINVWLKVIRVFSAQNGNQDDHDCQDSQWQWDHQDGQERGRSSTSDRYYYKFHEKYDFSFF